MRWNPFIKPGDPLAISADEFNRRQSEIERRSQISASPPLILAEDETGRRLAWSARRGFFATIHGPSNPYGFTEAISDGSGGWTDGAWAGSGTAPDLVAFEINLVVGLDGLVFWLEPGAAGDLRFDSQQCCGGGTPDHPTFCVAVGGCNGDRTTLATITITDPASVVTTGSIPFASGLVCCPANSSGVYTVKVTAPGYYELDFTYTVTLVPGVPSYLVSASLTPTTQRIRVLGCNGQPLEGASVTLSGAITGSCSTDSSGYCTFGVSNALAPGDSYTLTVSKSPRFSDQTLSETIPSSNPRAFGGTVIGSYNFFSDGLCDLQISIGPAPDYVCCFDGCEPHCKVMTLDTPFGSCTVGPAGLDTYRCTFTKTVLAWDYRIINGGQDYQSLCQVYGSSLGEVEVEFDVRMNACDGTVSVSYLTCVDVGCGSIGMRVLPEGKAYFIFALTATCTAAGSGICPPDSPTAMATISGSTYCDGTYMLSEAC